MGCRKWRKRNWQKSIDNNYYYLIVCFHIEQCLLFLTFATRYRICGNEFYRSGDFDDAILEYTKSINIIADPRSFNNRAMTCMYNIYAHT